MGLKNDGISFFKVDEHSTVSSILMASFTVDVSTSCLLEYCFEEREFLHTLGGSIVQL